MRSGHLPVHWFWNFVSIYYSFEVMRDLKFHLHLICIILNIIIIPNQVHNFISVAMATQNLKALALTVSEKSVPQNLAERRKKETRKDRFF